MNTYTRGGFKFYFCDVIIPVNRSEECITSGFFVDSTQITDNANGTIEQLKTRKKEIPLTIKYGNTVGVQLRRERKKR